MAWNEGKKAFLAGEALATKRRVRLKDATSTSPPEVVYADAGEYAIGVTEHAAASGDQVTVKLINGPGTFEIEASGAIAEGGSIYGTNDGKIDDSGTGTAFGIAMQAGSGSGAIVEVAVYPYLATTAGTVSVADSGGNFGTDTVEAALAQIAGRLKKARIDPYKIALEDGTALTTYSADPVPGWAQLSNKEVVLKWGSHATPGDAVANFILPDDLDGSAAVEIHFLAAMSAANDTPEMTMEAYIGAGDTDCAGTDDEVDGGVTLTEYTMSIAHGDVPDTGPAHLSVVFHPKDGEMGTDDMYVYGIWAEYTRVIT